MTDSKTCAICDQSFEAHSKDCPQGMVEMLRKQRTLDIQCPACQAQQIGTNAAGLYECRYCHAQYKAGMKSVLPSKGLGEFPGDKSLEEWSLKAKQARMEAVRKRMQA